MTGFIKKFTPNRVKKAIKKILGIESKDKEISKQKKEISELKYQIEYFKHHFDIQQMKPATGYLREFQLKELSFTQEVLKMLEPHNIKPFLDGGALLGACRHGGFIPWDDDIDLCLIRKDFDKLVEVAKKNFVWIDSTKKDCFSAKFYDLSIKANPGKYVFILTPFCLHLFKGTCLRDSSNLEFFPLDYIREDITEKQYLLYREKICNFVHEDHTWKEKFDFYQEVLANNDIYSSEPTSRVAPGLGSWDLTEYKFHGFRKHDDIFPLQAITFEGVDLPGPNKPKEILNMQFGQNWMQFPSDVGIPHTLQEQNIYLKTIGTPIDYSEF